MLEVSVIGAGYVKPMSYLAQLARVCTNRQNTDILTSMQNHSTNDRYNELPKIDEAKDYETVVSALRSGHGMVFEGLTFQFLAQNISRACLAQLTTHRLLFARLTQSQRYVKYKEDSEFWKNHYMPKLEYITDDKRRAEALNEFRLAYEEDKERYQRLELLGVRPEDNRFHTSQAAPTTTTFGMNLRELLYVIFPLRTARHAQSEIRTLAMNMLTQLESCYSHDKYFRAFLTFYETEWLPKMCQTHSEWTR